jgi:hypothetical protein
MTMRILIFVMAAALLAGANVPAHASCQPTISEPCTQEPPADKSADQTKPAGSKKKTNQSANSPTGGVRLTPDSGFGMDKGGLGTQRQIKGGLAIPF